jgi:PTH1 family peptidyl-tRNA hydrolase
MKLIVGLGNPGEEYKDTRHNLGFMLIDRLFERTHARRYRVEANAKVAEVTVAGQRVLLVKPQTFMNLSGNAVRPLLDHHAEGKSHNVIAVCDDIALPSGMIRIRARGSAGGQKGLQSIIDRLGSQDFPRVRVGIKPDHKVASLSDFVLSRISKREMELIDAALDRAADAVEVLIAEGAERAMSLFNERVKTEGDEQ